jgi:Ca-activated chloride channel family protein
MNGLILVCLALLNDGPTPPADDSPKVVVTQPDESKFPDINVYFEVRRPDGTFIRDAKREEFRVTEDGRDRPILAFDSPVTITESPTTIVLVVDRSGSMAERGKMRALKRAVGTFLEGLPAGSRIALIAFGSEVELVCPFTTDKEQVRAAVDAIRPVGATRYFDAVHEALKELEDQPGRRCVLALTDGLDTDSQVPIDEVIAEARRLSLPVHTLGLGEGREINTEALDHLARETRGQSYRARDAESLKAIYQELAERLGSSYSLTYQTDRKIPDGTLRPIRIYYSKSQAAAETAVFIPGMVVPLAGWSRLFLLLIAALVALTFVPRAFRQRAA